MLQSRQFRVALLCFLAFIVAITITGVIKFGVLAKRPLSQDEYTSQTIAAGFTVQDPPRAYNMAKLLCAGKGSGDFESSVENLTRLATFDHPKTEDQIKRYIEIVRSVC